MRETGVADDKGTLSSGPGRAAALHQLTVYRAGISWDEGQRGQSC